MNDQYINKICEVEFNETPQKIEKKMTGICNEVYEIYLKKESYILRMNSEKKFLYGTHAFLPIFQKLQIKTPSIVAEDYSKNKVPFCYQILSKIKGIDLGIVIDDLTQKELKLIAIEISRIFDKFNTFPQKDSFGEINGLGEERYKNLFEIIKNQQKTILERNSKTGVIDKEIINILNKLIQSYKNYYLEVKPKLYYDDINSKNVMVYQGKFSGLVDLDFLMKGDYLEAIGRIMASWYGDKHREVYIKEVIKQQYLDGMQQKVVKMYAVLNLIYWMSEEGIKFNSNSSGVINWNNVRDKKEKIVGLFNEIIE